MTIITPLLLTLILETPVYYFGLRQRKFLPLLYLILMNVLTNVSMNCLILIENPFSLYVPSLYFYELMATLIEGLLIYYALLPKAKSFLIAILANLLSLVIGLLLGIEATSCYESWAFFYSLIALLVIEWIVFGVWIYRNREKKA